VQEIHGAINGVEHPKKPAAGWVAAFFLTQKRNLWRLVVQEVADEALHGQVNL
jgi:hypothetical protein